MTLQPNLIFLIFVFYSVKQFILGQIMSGKTVWPATYLKQTFWIEFYCKVPSSMLKGLTRGEPSQLQGTRYHLHLNSSRNCFEILARLREKKFGASLKTLIPSLRGPSNLRERDFRSDSEEKRWRGGDRAQMVRNKNVYLVYLFYSRLLT